METPSSEKRSEIADIVAKSGRKLKLGIILAGFVFWVAATSALWFILFFIDNFLALPPEMRLPLSLAGALITCYLFFTKTLSPTFKIDKLEKTAVELEKKLEIPNNILINSCQFEQTPLKPEENSFARKTIALSSELIKAGGVFNQADRLLFAKLIIFAIIALGLWIFYITFCPKLAANAWQRYSRPLLDIPPAESFTLSVEPHGAITLVQGEDLSILATIKQDGKSSAAPRTPPLIVWGDGTEPLRKTGEASEKAVMPASSKEKDHYRHTFQNIQNNFTFRVFAGKTYSELCKVLIRPIPKIKKSIFRIFPPAYTGTAPFEQAGPPSSPSILEGSIIEVKIDIDRPATDLIWKDSKRKSSMKSKSSREWSTKLAPSPGEYSLTVTEEFSKKNYALAKGSVRFSTDQAPKVRFLNQDPNKLANPGSKVELSVESEDDYGLSELVIVFRPLSDSKAEKALKTWTYLGPPGKKGKTRENFSLVLRPDMFLPGESYIFQAKAMDFRPKKQFGISKPLLVRIKSLEEMLAPPSDSLAKAFILLRETIKAQGAANAVSANVKLHHNEILKKDALKKHSGSMATLQRKSESLGQKTLLAFHNSSEGTPYAGKLDSIIKGEMKWVLDDIQKLSSKNFNVKVEQITERQNFILLELVRVLGEIADKRVESIAKKKEESNEKSSETEEAVSSEELGRQLKDDLEEFAKSQKRMIETAKSMLNKGPDDLTEDEEKILGELAREQAKWADFFEDKLDDFSKLPHQDFADGAMADEFNEVFQEIKLAEKKLYEKKIELAVPHEQSGLEKAEEIIHNLERWLPDMPDHVKWSMEEPFQPQEAPLAELPDELEDIVGELLDSEEAMTDEVEDVTSSWMDSLDKGAGWGVGDGPISNMSARGVTGNLLPNNNEIGGRSGEGRSGRSHGQMVESAADGKGGRQTPTRLTPSPFEQGSVADASQEATGGSTGGGKLSGFTGEGLRGPAPPEIGQKMARIAGRQSQIRQRAEKLAMKLRAYHVPSGDLETSIKQMKDLEKAVKEQRVPMIKRSFTRIVDHLKSSKTIVRGEIRSRRERIKLPSKIRSEIISGFQEKLPRGYEKMAGEYFKALANEKSK